MLMFILVPLWYGFMANKRGRNSIGWAFLGLIIFFALKLIVTLIAVNSRATTQSEAVSLTIVLNIIMYGGAFFIAFIIPKNENIIDSKNSTSDLTLSKQNSNGVNVDYDKWCKKCKHFEFNLSKGIVCDITDEKPNFVDECKDFILKPTKILDEKTKSQSVAMTLTCLRCGTVYLLGIDSTVYCTESGLAMMGRTNFDRIYTGGAKRKESDLITKFNLNNRTLSEAQSESKRNINLVLNSLRTHEADRKWYCGKCRDNKEKKVEYNYPRI